MFHEIARSQMRWLRLLKLLKKIFYSDTCSSGKNELMPCLELSTFQLQNSNTSCSCFIIVYCVKSLCCFQKFMGDHPMYNIVTCICSTMSAMQCYVG